MTNGNVIYPNERDIIQLRKGFRLTADGYLSRGSLLYVIEIVQDLYNEYDMADKLAAKAAHILFKIATAHPSLTATKEHHLARPIFFSG